jgi:hypothetical protein
LLSIKLHKRIKKFIKNIKKKNKLLEDNAIQLLGIRYPTTTSSFPFSSSYR